MDWSSLLSTLIGALVGLGGVLVSQRSERKKAHADRVWAARAQIYQRLYQHADEYETWCRDIRFNAMDPTLTLIRPAKTNFSAEDTSQLALFGSSMVYEAYQACWPKILYFNNWWAQRGEAPVTEDEIKKWLEPVITSTGRVENQITSETRGD
jgi:hypothetical protein